MRLIEENQGRGVERPWPWPAQRPRLQGAGWEPGEHRTAAGPWLGSCKQARLTPASWAHPPPSTWPPG